MTTDRELYLLARCLRLEAEKAIAQGKPIESPPPEPPTLSSLDAIATMPNLRRHNRHVGANDIAAMRELRERGQTYEQIASLLKLSQTTVRIYTRDVLLEREVGAT